MIIMINAPPLASSLLIPFLVAHRTNNKAEINKVNQLLTCIVTNNITELN